MTAARPALGRVVPEPVRFQQKGPGSRPPRSHHARAEGPQFKPGDPVKETGIYEVIHEGAHRTAHDAVMLANDAFPPCDTCGLSVRFRLIRTAPYIFDDDDFED